MKTLDQALADLTSTYSQGFLELMGFVLPHEVVFDHGHYGDYDHVATEHDPNDPGGTTRYGLDAASHPHLDIESLTFDEACAEYYAEIWEPLHGDEMDAEVALALCDSAINCGSVRSARWMQTLAGLTGDDVDGSIGKESIGAINAHPPHELAAAFNARRLAYYQTEVRPSLQKLYLAGWENRMTDLNTALA